MRAFFGFSGRQHDLTGVDGRGFALPRQERPLEYAMKG